ncbi:cell division protein FtsZ, partial [bacterium]|nr:cell division protein FtsZ [bacterium]
IGAVVDDNIQGEIQITVIATGFELKSQMPIEANRIDVGAIFTGLKTNPMPTMPRPSSIDIELPEFLRK